MGIHVEYQEANGHCGEGSKMVKEVGKKEEEKIFMKKLSLLHCNIKLPCLQLHVTNHGHRAS